MSSVNSKTLKQRIYEVAMNAFSKCYYTPVRCSIVDTVINTVTITLPEITEEEQFVQTTSGDYLLSTDGYVLTAKNS